MPKRAGGDQAVDARPDGESQAPSRSIQIDGLSIHVHAEWRFHDRQRQHRFTRAQERGLGVESLKDFLDHGKTGHDVIEVDKGFELNTRRLPEDLYPDGGVNENHDVASDTPLCLLA